MGIVRERLSSTYYAIDRYLDRDWGARVYGVSDGQRYLDYQITDCPKRQEVWTAVRDWENRGYKTSPENVLVKAGDSLQITVDRRLCWGWTGPLGKDEYDPTAWRRTVPVYTALGNTVPVRRYVYYFYRNMDVARKGFYMGKDGTPCKSANLKLRTDEDVITMCGNPDCLNHMHMLKVDRETDVGPLYDFIEYPQGDDTGCWRWTGHTTAMHGHIYPDYPVYGAYKGAARILYNDYLRDHPEEPTLKASEILHLNCPEKDPLCVAPHHRTRGMRGEFAPTRAIGLPDRCRNGHNMLDGEGNVVGWGKNANGRYCIHCRKDSIQRARDRWRAFKADPGIVNIPTVAEIPSEEAAVSEDLDTSYFES